MVNLKKRVERGSNVTQIWDPCFTKHLIIPLHEWEVSIHGYLNPIPTFTVSIAIYLLNSPFKLLIMMWKLGRRDNDDFVTLQDRSVLLSSTILSPSHLSSCWSARIPSCSSILDLTVFMVSNGKTSNLISFPAKRFKTSQYYIENWNAT